VGRFQRLQCQVQLSMKGWSVNADSNPPAHAQRDPWLIQWESRLGTANIRIHPLIPLACNLLWAWSHVIKWHRHSGQSYEKHDDGDGTLVCLNQCSNDNYMHMLLFICSCICLLGAALCVQSSWMVKIHNRGFKKLFYINTLDRNDDMITGTNIGRSTYQHN
jgi:hypothetical protein